MAKWTKFFVDIRRMALGLNASSETVEDILIDHFKTCVHNRCKFKSIQGWGSYSSDDWEIADYAYLMLKFKSLTDATMFKLQFGEYIVLDIASPKRV